MKRQINEVVENFNIEVIGVGDGQGCFETEKIVSDVIADKDHVKFCRVRNGFFKKKRMLIHFGGLFSRFLKPKI